MSLTDARQMYVMLRDSGPDGMHSHELRRRGVSGNPSQRAKDIVSRGVAVWTARENVGKRPGSRYWLAEHAPDWAVPVRPNHAARTCENCGGSLEGRRADAKFCGDTCRSEAREAPVAVQSRAREQLSATPAAPDTHEPTAIVRTGDGFTELPLDGPRACRRCANTGFIGPNLPCPACDGEGLISRRRVNSFDEEREAA